MLAGAMAPRTVAVLLLLGLAARPETSAKGDALAELERRYGIRVVVAPQAFSVRWGPLSLIRGDVPREASVASYAPLLAEEFGVYPPAFVGKTRLWAIYLCKDLRYADQRRTAIPDHLRNILYLDVERGRHDERYVRRVIHHEFFHMVDVADDGQFYRDDGWARLNPDGFRYGSGGASMQEDPTASLPDESVPGFLNRYSTSALHEDKAEVFAHLLCERAALERRAAKDPVLRRKAAYLEALLGKFCPEASPRAWLAARRS
jgi:hypothetical protein